MKTIKHRGKWKYCGKRYIINSDYRVFMRSLVIEEKI